MYSIPNHYFLTHTHTNVHLHVDPHMHGPSLAPPHFLSPRDVHRTLIPLSAKSIPVAVVFTFPVRIVFLTENSKTKRRLEKHCSTLLTTRSSSSQDLDSTLKVMSRKSEWWLDLAGQESPAIGASWFVQNRLLLGTADSQRLHGALIRVVQI